TRTRSACSSLPIGPGRLFHHTRPAAATSKPARATNLPRWLRRRTSRSLAERSEESAMARASHKTRTGSCGEAAGEEVGPTAGGCCGRTAVARCPRAPRMKRRQELEVEGAVELPHVIGYLEQLVQALKSGAARVQRGDEQVILGPRG